MSNLDEGGGSWTLLTRTGRRTRYTVNHDSMFRHPAQDGHRIGPFLSVFAGSGEDARMPGQDGR
jgi:hypothetical protein